MLSTPPESIHILVVDDEEPFRNLLKLSLERAGYRVRSARSGYEALDFLQQAPRSGARSKP